MKRLWLAIAVSFAVGVPGSSAGAAVGGAISGTIHNATAGASLPSQLVVSASQLSDQGNEITRKETNAGSDGKFRVEGFDFSAGRRVFVGTDYRGVTYSAFVEVPEGAEETTADITIFESTDDDSGISILSDVLTVVPGKKNTLEVIQLMRIKNSNDRTYVGTVEGNTRMVLHLPLPQGARDFLPLEGIRPEGVTEAGEGFTTADPLLPGESSLSYVYRIKVARSGWPLKRSIPYQTNRIDLLAEKSVAVKAPRLRFREFKILEKKTYRRYQGGPFLAGEQLEANIGSGSASSSLWWGLAATLGGLTILVLAAAVYRRNRSAPAPPSAPDRERFIEEIAKLDERFAAGEMDQDEYRRTRHQLKNELQSITDRLASADR